MVQLADDARARASDPETSHIAAAEATCEVDDKIVELLKESMSTNPTGRVPRDVTDMLVLRGYDIHSIAPRFKPLREAGFIKFKLRKSGSIVKRLSQGTKKLGRVHILGDGRTDSIVRPLTNIEKAKLRIADLELENAQLRTRLTEHDATVRIWKSVFSKRRIAHIT